MAGIARPFRIAADVQAAAEHGRLLRSPVTTGRRIVVTGGHRGSGKSTVAALIAAVLARHRQDRILDLDPGTGSLPLRLGVRAGPSLADLARAGLETASFDAVGPRPARRGPALDGARAYGGLDAAVYRAAYFPSAGSSA